jgi:hypothetical protein
MNYFLLQFINFNHYLNFVPNFIIIMNLTLLINLIKLIVIRFFGLLIIK